MFNYTRFKKMKTIKEKLQLRLVQDLDELKHVF